MQWSRARRVGRRNGIDPAKTRWSGAVPGGRDGATESTQRRRDGVEPCPEGGTAQRNRPTEEEMTAMLSNTDPALRRAWHVVAQSSEVGLDPVAVRLLGESWVLV